MVARMLVLAIGCLLIVAPINAGTGGTIARGKSLPVQGCTGFTLEEMAELFFTQARWEEGRAPGGQRMISVWGQLAYPNPEGVYARLWYELHPERGLIYRSIDFSGIVQQNWIYEKRLRKVCGS